MPPLGQLTRGDLPHDPQLRRTDAERTRLERDMGLAQREVQSLKSQLSRMTSTSQRRLKELFDKSPDVRKVMEWLQVEETRKLFRREVLGPIAIEARAAAQRRPAISPTPPSDVAWRPPGRSWTRGLIARSH